VLDYKNGNQDTSYSFVVVRLIPAAHFHFFITNDAAGLGGIIFSIIAAWAGEPT
jgi:hypothetical protein